MQDLGDVIVLDRPATLMDGPTVLHPTALTDELAQAGYALGQVRRVVVTHHDLDHIGSVDDVGQATGAAVYALEDEVPFITSDRRAQHLPPPEQIQILCPLRDGDQLPEDVRVSATPGHTSRPPSLLAPGGKVLISGDALTSQDGPLLALATRRT